MLFKAFLTALSAYSVIPARVKEWDDRAMKYALMFLPAVGAICGICLYLWQLLCGMLSLSPMIFAIIAVCIPLFVTGGIHVDGFMDTVDALSSHQPRERKLEILKDSHPGAFAVIWLLVYMMLCFAFYYELGGRSAVNGVPGNKALYAVIPMFVLSRSLSAINVCTLPNARQSGMLYSYTKDSAKRETFFVCLIIAALAVFVMIFTGGAAGIFSAAAGIVSVFFYRMMAMKQFSGTTGDTAGFFLQICEGACLFGAWAGSLIA